MTMSDHSTVHRANGKTRSTEKKKNGESFVRKWGVPSLVLCLGTYAVVTGQHRTASSSSAALWMASEEEPRGLRQLALPYNESATLTLPAWTNNIADVWDTLDSNHQPFFWYIPKGGGSTIVKLLAYCLGLTQCSNKGQHTDVSTLGVYEIGSPSPYPHIPKYVNVQTQSEAWLNLVASKGVISSGLADVLVTQHLAYAGSNVFTSGTYKGRIFAMFRHPVKRIVDQFYYRQHATWEGTFDADLAAMSLDEFSVSDKFVENFEVKSLLGLTGDVALTVTDLNLAKEILRRKVVVGIFEWFDVSIVRFEKYFGWWTSAGVMQNYTVNNCHYDFIRGGDHQGNHPPVPHSENTYKRFEIRNWADVELYHFAKNLFADQIKLLGMV